MSTLVYVDKKLIITDASREPEDYKKMGLPTKRNRRSFTCLFDESWFSRGEV